MISQDVRDLSRSLLAILADAVRIFLAEGEYAAQHDGRMKFDFGTTRRRIWMWMMMMMMMLLCCATLDF
jgi:hypothetical protein